MTPKANLGVCWNSGVYGVSQFVCVYGGLMWSSGAHWDTFRPDPTQHNSAGGNNHQINASPLPVLPNPILDIDKL